MRLVIALFSLVACVEGSSSDTASVSDAKGGDDLSADISSQHAANCAYERYRCRQEGGTNCDALYTQCVAFNSQQRVLLETRADSLRDCDFWSTTKSCDSQCWSAYLECRELAEYETPPSVFRFPSCAFFPEE